MHLKTTNIIVTNSLIILLFAFWAGFFCVLALLIEINLPFPLDAEYDLVVSSLPVSERFNAYEHMNDKSDLVLLPIDKRGWTSGRSLLEDHYSKSIKKPEYFKFAFIRRGVFAERALYKKALSFYKSRKNQRILEILERKDSYNSKLIFRTKLIKFSYAAAIILILICPAFWTIWLFFNLIKWFINLLSGLLKL